MTGCEALAGLALFACIARNPACLPPEHTPLLPYLAAVAEQESGFRPLAIRDEATGESLFPATPAQAVRIATARDAAGHTLGLGWFQITHRANWQRHGLTITTALEPCANLRAGAAHYVADLHAAAARRFNSGRIADAPPQSVAYARRVAVAAERLRGPLAAVSANAAALAVAPDPPEIWDVWALPVPGTPPAPPSAADASEAASAGEPPDPSRLVVELTR